jgi:hypothetical protein
MSKRFVARKKAWTNELLKNSFFVVSILPLRTIIIVSITDETR